MRGMTTVIAGLVIAGCVAVGSVVGIGDSHHASPVNPAGTFTLNSENGTVTFGDGAHGAVPARVGAVVVRYGQGGAAGNVASATPQVTSTVSSTSQVFYGSGSSAG